PGLPPAIIQFVNFVLALQVQPDHDRFAITVVLAEGCIREEHTALPLRDAADPALVVTPVEMEPEHIHVILAALLDLPNRNLGNRLGKVREHVSSLRHWILSAGNGKAVRASARLPTHAIRPHEWGTRGMG